MRFSMRRHSSSGRCAPRRSCSNVTFCDVGDPLHSIGGTEVETISSIAPSESDRQQHPAHGPRVPPRGAKGGGAPAPARRQLLAWS